MARFDVALDDYLHQIVRTRPWVKKREEQLLTGFGEWLVAQPDLDAGLASITPLLVRRYAADEGIDGPTYTELEIALQNFCGWATYAGLIPANSPHAYHIESPA